ncbi:uncharacterized protein V1516DRAFT_697145 [Lipomyces oligophaga]|uniref:uncharacterized protein n=1 Tax=Lipomyces oligophaga TaxID=45792 RepID=UPI0034CED601
MISPSTSASSTASSSASSVMNGGSPIQVMSSSPTSQRSYITPPPPPPPQLRQLKKPVYLPAVLRYGTSLKVNDVDWSQQLFWGKLKPVTGPPSRVHWVSDESSLGCRNCSKQFTFWDRRHHCRRCGQIFCSDHSSHILRLDQNNNFHPGGTLSRTCDDCANEFNQSVKEALQSAKGAESNNNINYINRMVRDNIGGSASEVQQSSHSSPAALLRRRAPGSNFYIDISDDERSLTSGTSTTTQSALSTPQGTSSSTRTGQSYFASIEAAVPQTINASGTDSIIPTSAILNGDGSYNGAAFLARTQAEAESRQIAQRLQRQLGVTGALEIPAQEGSQLGMTPTDKSGSYVPTDWNWSTF